MPNTDSTTNFYDKAREVLRERGWQQGAPQYDDDDGVCLLGACAVALGERATGWGALDDAVTRTLGEIILDEFPESRVQQVKATEYVPWVWNDENGRTLDDVDLVLDKAARRWDEQVQP